MPKQKQEQEKQALRDVEDSKFELRIFRVRSENNLEEAIYRAREAIEKNDAMARANAFFDIRLALKIRKIAYGLESALGRMESVLKVKQSMKNFGETVKKIDVLVKKQPSFSVNKLADIYEKTMGMVSAMSDKMDKFDVSSMSIQLSSEDMSISDREIEKLVKGEINVDMIQSKEMKQTEGLTLSTTSNETAEQEAITSTDSLLEELSKLIASE